ncbi:MAG: hypothetical protein BECKG1743D_GA0114223_109812, partial [Candidatus Kentron sp. G]
MRLSLRLEAEQNTAQSGMFFSGNRLKHRERVTHLQSRAGNKQRLLLDSGLIFYDHGCFAGYLPRRGCVFQPRVAAPAATL